MRTKRNKPIPHDEETLSTTSGSDIDVVSSLFNPIATQFKQHVVTELGTSDNSLQELRVHLKVTILEQLLSLM